MTNHLVPSAKARTITEEVEAAVAAIFEKHGFEAPKSKTTYGDHYAVKLTATPLSEGENGINLNSPEAQGYLVEANYDDTLDPDALGREIVVNGETFIFEGYVSRRPKYPFVARRVSDGKSYKLTDSIRPQLRVPADA